MTSTGWTFGTVDELTMEQLMSLLDYWQRWPPLHQMIGAYFGFGKSKAPDPSVLAGLPGGKRVKHVVR